MNGVEDLIGFWMGLVFSAWCLGVMSSGLLGSIGFRGGYVGLG